MYNSAGHSFRGFVPMGMVNRGPPSAASPVQTCTLRGLQHPAERQGIAGSCCIIIANVLRVVHPFADLPSA